MQQRTEPPKAFPSASEIARHFEEHYPSTGRAEEHYPPIRGSVSRAEKSGKHERTDNEQKEIIREPKKQEEIIQDAESTVLTRRKEDVRRAEFDLKIAKLLE